MGLVVWRPPFAPPYWQTTIKGVRCYCDAVGKDSWDPSLAEV